ncbi:MAG: alpha/beta fold hydrolase, partial [Stackebrandtia sp.]
IKLPILIIGGHRDVASRPVDSLTLSAALPDAQARLLSDCGHFAMAEQPETFAALVNNFALATAPPPTTTSEMERP